MKASLSDIAKAVDGVLTGSDAKFAGVSTDTRTLGPGELFVALTGPNFDGADYLDVAVAKGAVGAVVSKRRDVDLPQIEVGDTRRALGQLGSWWRDQHRDLSIVGITGSNGKTTLKELTGSILGGVAKTFVTTGNMNNEIGVPLMLSRIDDSCEYAVIEMGANRIGDIEYLTSLVKPNVVALTNAGPAHLEGFGSIKGVSRGKGEILSGMPRPEAAVLNADDNYFEYWCGLVEDIRMLSFGMAANAISRAEDIVLDASGSSFTLCLPDSRTKVRLALTGEHNVRNACAAAAIAHALGIDAVAIKSGLEAVTPVDGRLADMVGRNGARLFDDSYNANPTSVTAAAGFLASLDGESCFILGDMGELGPDEVQLHRDTGAAIREAGVDRLLATGDLSKAAVEGFGPGAEWFDSIDALTEAATAMLAPGLNVLVKGSRLAAMERVVAALVAEHDPMIDSAREAS